MNPSGADGPLNATEIEHLRREALTLRSKGQHHEALSLFRRIAASLPGDARSTIDVGISLAASDCRDAAIQVLAAIFPVASRMPALKRVCALHLAQAHRHFGARAESRRWFGIAAESAAGDFPTLVEVAEALMLWGDLEGSQRLLDEAEVLVRDRPGHPHAHQLRRRAAALALARGNDNEAIARLGAPDAANDPAALRQLVETLLALGRVEDASERLDFALASGMLAAESEDVICLTLDLLRASGRRQAATLMAKMHLRIDPACGKVRQRLSELNRDALDLDAAVGALDGCRPGSTVLAKAKLLKQRGAFEEARALLADHGKTGFKSGAQRSEALRLLTLINLFNLRFDHARCRLNERFALDDLDGRSAGLSQFYADQLDIFEHHEASLRHYEGVESILELSRIRRRHEATLDREGRASSSLIYMKRLAILPGWNAALYTRLARMCAGSSRIPRTIVQYWDQGHPPDDVLRTMASWPTTYPDFAYRRFDRESAAAFIAKHHAGAIIQHFEAAPHAAMRADIFRMAWLATHGGFYVDADERAMARSCFFKLDADLVVPIVLTNDGQIQNHVLGAVANHPLVMRFLAALGALPSKAITEGLVWWVSGPGHFGSIISAHIAEQLADKTAGDTVFDVLVSADLVLCPASLLELQTPRLAYKTSTSSWQKARSDAVRGEARTGTGRSA